MATQSKSGRSLKDGGSKSVSMPAIIIAAAVLVVFFGWMAYRTFGPAPLPPEKPSAGATRIFKVFTDSGGDWDKVSPADQQWIHEFSGGKEQMAWAAMKAGHSQNH